MSPVYSDARVRNRSPSPRQIYRDEPMRGRPVAEEKFANLDPFRSVDESSRPAYERSLGRDVRRDRSISPPREYYSTGGGAAERFTTSQRGYPHDYPPGPSSYVDSKRDFLEKRPASPSYESRLPVTKQARFDYF